MKYVKSISEVNVVVPKNKAGMPIKKSIDIVCDMCEINFESFTNLGEHITKKHQRKKDFCCCACDGKFFYQNGLR